MEHDLTVLRDSVAKTKQLRDSLRTENQVMKQNQGFVGSDLLVVDFDTRKRNIEVLENKLSELQVTSKNFF